MKVVDVKNEKPDRRKCGMRAVVKEAYFTESGESLLGLLIEYSYNINGVKVYGEGEYIEAPISRGGKE